MASLIAYTKQQLVERIRRHMSNGFPTSDFSASVNEVLLYIDQALAYTLVGQVYAGAKVEGNIAIPEAWLTTYTLPSLAQDTPSGFWYSTLPQPPVSLPLGYSISRVYAAQAGSGQSQDFLPIEAKRVSYRRHLPMPTGPRYWVEGTKIWMAMNDASSLYGYTIYAVMAKTRTESLTETMNLPDDAIEMIFQNVVAKLKDRMQIPADIIQDDLPAGNKGS
jgi:hypothetical protein